MPPKANDVSTSRPEFDLEPGDTQASALQTHGGTVEAEWEGFDEEDEAISNNDGSDNGSMDIVVEKKQKKEKPVLPKDAEEEELERLIFGDSAGFRRGVESFSLDISTAAVGGEQGDKEDGEVDLADVADQDLFFFDAGPTIEPAGPLVVAGTDPSEDEADKPAWEDSDDERVVVSLASVPQLRKLRETAEDDMVNGREYVRRLRNQYERLYPAPEWAIHATGKAKRKRHQAQEDDDSEEESPSDMDVDDDLSAQPLARLLKDADILSRTSRNPAKRRKLQAGTIDIQRLKDVSNAGPVGRPSSTPLLC